MICLVVVVVVSFLVALYVVSADYLFVLHVVVNCFVVVHAVAEFLPVRWSVLL